MKYRTVMLQASSGHIDPKSNAGKVGQHAPTFNLGIDQPVYTKL